MSVVFAQTQSPAQKIRLARATFEQGRLHELPRLLEKLDKFSKSEKVEAYKLLAQTYVYLEEPEKADEAMLNLLRTDHYFEVNEAVDPAEFVALYNTFRTTAVYRFGAKLGSNITQPNVLSYNAINNGSSSYKYQFGFNAMVTAEIPLPFLRNRLTINPELGFIIKSFSYKGQVLNYNEVVTSQTAGKESQKWITLPISLQYQLKENRLNPYVALGGSADYLISSGISAEQKRPGNQAVESRNFKANPLREKLNINLSASVGMKMKITGGYLTAELRAYYGLSKINSSKTLLNNQYLTYDYQYVDGIYKLNSISITVGYIYNIFNPVKLKN
ncbi:MAG: hypothetical protein DI538_04880 [Azospira oryzae]|nr:MAG: hypothetical protein DI538_04880 [Azospira oryzae]